MLSNSHRLSSGDVSDIMEKGRFSHSPLFVIRWIEYTGHSRLGSLVPVKVCKKAVDRNKLRRMMYISIRKIYAHILPNLKIIVMAKNARVNQNQQEIDTAIKDVFLKAKLLQ